MRSYEAARTYFNILGFISWAVIVLGGVVALISLAAVGQMSRSYGGSSMAGLAGTVPGIAIMFAGFMGLVLVQIGRAGVDTAEYTQQMLKIARDQLEVSQQSLRSGGTAPTSFAGLPGQTRSDQGVASFAKVDASYGSTPASVDVPLPDGVQKVIEYRGRMILKQEDRYIVEGKSFLNLSYAQKRVDELVEGKA